MNPADPLVSLDGQPVLVRPVNATELNSVGMRGSLRVQASGAESGSRAALVLSFPEMVGRPAHERVILLDEVALKKLLATRSESGGYAYTLDETIEEEAVPGEGAASNP